MQVQAVPGDVHLEDGGAVSPQDPESEVPGELRVSLSLWDSTSMRLFKELLTRLFKLQTSARHSEGKLEEALCDLTFFPVVTFPHSRVRRSGVSGLLEILPVNFCGNFNSCFSLPTLPLAFLLWEFANIHESRGNHVSS